MANKSPGLIKLDSVGMLSQSSETDGRLQLTAARQELESAFVWMLSGQTSAGALLSNTLITKLQEAVLPKPSLTVKVATVTPTEKVSPETTVPLSVGIGSQASANWGAANVAIALQPNDVSAWRNRSVGQMIVGATSSVTVISKLQVAVLPELSIAVKVTTLMPAGKVSPDSKSLLTTGA